MKNAKPAKGQYGYRNYHKKIELLKILTGIGLILILLGVRMGVKETAWKNILTVSAILTVLPTANLASPFFASIRYRTPGEEFHQKLSAYEGKIPVLYDLILTSGEFILPMDGIFVHPTGVYCYCTNPKISVPKAEATFNQILRAHHLDPHMKIILEESAFWKRADSLKPAAEYEDDGSVDYTVKLLKNLSM